MSKSISHLRQRTIEDMTIRNMSPNTQTIYVQAVANFSAFHGRSPAKLGLEEVRAYRLHLSARNLQPTTINPIMGALRFFYKTTLGRPDIADQIPCARIGDALPAVLSREEVERFLGCVSGVKMRAAFATIYGGGLRVSELVTLTLGDIDGARMVLTIRHGKGDKDRYVMLSEQLLAILRDYWKRARPSHWLFPGPDPSQPITVQRACREAAERAGLAKPVTVHTLRHSFATHLLEQYVDIRVIQGLLGHRNINSTTRYTRVAVDVIRQVQSPLDHLTIRRPSA
jgi:site-specific recombinase XerD